jgi:hypothetical protein
MDLRANDGWLTKWKERHRNVCKYIFMEKSMVQMARHLTVF